MKFGQYFKLLGGKFGRIFFGRNGDPQNRLLLGHRHRHEEALGGPAVRQRDRQEGHSGNDGEADGRDEDADKSQIPQSPQIRPP
jgi:hypothetical protein